MKHRSFLLTTALILTSALLFQQSADSQQGKGGGRGGAKNPTQIEAVQISSRLLQDKLQLTGTAIAAERFTIASRTSGRLVSLPLKMGQYVRNGEIVARMEEQNYQQALAQVTADIAVIEAQKQEVRANLLLAEQEFDRDATLYGKKLLSETELETSRTGTKNQRAKLEVLQAQSRQKEITLRGGQLDLNDTRIKAQWPGGGSRVVSRRLIDPGAIIGVNTPLLELVSLDPIVIQVAISEKDLARVRVGQSVSMQNDAYPEQNFMGSIARLSPVLDPDTRSAEAEIQIANPKHLLKPGMFLVGDLILASRPQALTVPLEAVLEREDGTKGVFVVETSPPEPGKEVSQTVRFVEIKTGFVDDPYIEILRPKINGPVVTLGNHLLSEGAAVRVVSPESKTLGAKPNSKKPGQKPGTATDSSLAPKKPNDKTGSAGAEQPARVKVPAGQAH